MAFAKRLGSDGLDQPRLVPGLRDLDIVLGGNFQKLCLRHHLEFGSGPAGVILFGLKTSKCSLRVRKLLPKLLDLGGEGGPAEFRMLARPVPEDPVPTPVMLVSEP